MREGTGGRGARQALRAAALGLLPVLLTACNVGTRDRADQGGATPSPVPTATATVTATPTPTASAEPTSRDGGETAPEAPTLITGAGETGTYDCRGRGVTITGASNKIRLVGRCTSVQVTGALNEVTVDSVGSIVVSGTQSKVIWRSGLDGGRPDVNVTGFGSSVTQG